LAENGIRPFVVGRKNFLFSGHPNGARALAIFYSLIETAKANKIRPLDYLNYVFAHIRSTPGDKMANLLPWKCDLG
ncbi:MAG: transposase domain-containing protein, partial [Desulfovibrio sp.]|nr:transposase domain-containing protein [Desulfovibrio sp.]